MLPAHCSVRLPHDFQLTRHAWQRMSRRGISPAVVRQVLEHGRTVYLKGVQARFIGERELARFARRGIDLSSARGVHVFCSQSAEGRVVITVYRSHDLRGLRPRRPRTRRARRT